MEAATRTPLRLPGLAAIRVDPPAVAAWLLPAVLIVYLALNNGGYGLVERSEAAIAIWWIVGVGTAVGALPVAGGTRAGRTMMVLLAAFAAWTAMSLSWTESSERTSIELARTLGYLGVFSLALAVQGEGRWRHLLNGVTAGVAFVCAIAVLSRLEPTWFPERNTGAFLVGIEIERRLAYPINYSSGLGALAAMTMPLLLAATASARTLVGQALAAAALPVAALTLWLTSSSISLPVAAIGLIAFLALAPDRLPKLGSLMLAGAGSAILFVAVEQRDALDRGLPTPAAQAEGDELAAIILIVCAGVALAQTGLGLALRYGSRPAWLTIPPARAAGALIVGVLAVSVLAAAAGAGTKLSERWDLFKGRAGSAEVSESRGSQILDVTSSGRYDFWRSATDANATDPWLGTGPGTFEFWWAREGIYAGFIRDAHSLYLESLAELGIVGLLLIGGFSLALLALGAVRALRAPPELRLGLAAATAGCAAFVAAGIVDWTWELAAMPVAFFCLAAVVVAARTEDEAWPGVPRRERPAERRPRGRLPIAIGSSDLGRAAIVALAAVSLVAISLPLATDSAIEDSRAAARSGDLDKALGEARDAVSLQPHAATPRLQEALVLERRRQFGAAAKAAREATRRESTNWRTWLILSRLEARRGEARAAVVAYRKARSLNPKSGVLAP